MNGLAVEIGGTTTRFIILRSDGTRSPIHRFPTKTPKLTFDELRHRLGDIKPQVAGVASFGPIETQEQSKKYGCIFNTPKKDWSHCSLLGAARTLGVQSVRIATDVSAAALAEQSAIIDPHIRCGMVAYVTVGTGIGVGISINSCIWNGDLHPEAGHIAAPRLHGDHFESACPFHECCVEGMASGLALQKRLRDGDPQCTDSIIGHYVGHLISSLVFTLSPHKIIVGGGVMKRRQARAAIRESVKRSLGSYHPRAKTSTFVRSMTARPTFPEPGLEGAIILAGV
jgi:fructokinase